jgi:uncharacterized protein
MIPRRMIIAGGSGFLGRSLIRLARPTFSDIVVLTRTPQPDAPGVRFVPWDARSDGPWQREVDGAHVLVNYVGRTVDCIKTPENRAQILNSRIDSVNALTRACQQADRPPAVWIQSATAHIHGDTDDEILTDDAPIGTGLAPTVGLAWEKALFDPELPATRKVALRISFVLGRDGGALSRLGKLTRWFLGGTVGSGRQWISWIHERDLSRIVLRTIEDDSFHGRYLVTAPHPVRNAEFMRELRRALRRPWSPPAPAWAVKIAAPLILRTDPELALLGRRCVPTKLLEAGFQFDFPELTAALRDIYNP